MLLFIYHLFYTERIEYLDLNTTAITVSVPVLKCAGGGDRQNYTVAGVSGYQMSFYKFDELVSETFGCPNGKYCSIYNGDNVS